MSDKGRKDVGLIGPAERVRRWRALARLEGRGDGRAFVEPGELVELPATDAAVYVAQGLIEAVDDDDPFEGGSGG